MARLKLKRIAPGFYVTADDRYEVVSFDSPRGKWWGWAKRGEACEDSYATKADAVAALAEWLTRR